MRGDVTEEWSQEEADQGLCTQEEVGTYKRQHPFDEQLPMPGTEQAAEGGCLHELRPSSDD